MKTNTDMARIAFRYCGGLAALFILFTSKLSAQETRVDEKPALQVSYQQDDSKYLVFKVSVVNTGNKRSILRVADKHEVLYSEAFNNDSYTKTIKVPKDGFNADALEFRLSNGKELIRKTFEISLMTKEVYEVKESEL